MKINYPFAAVPNQVLRAGLGTANIAVLAALLGHGRTTASAATIAEELGCARKTVFAAIKFWLEEGPTYGILLAKKGRLGETSVYEVTIERMGEPVPERAQVDPHPIGHATSAQKGTPPVPNRAHKEEPFKKTPEEDIAAQGAAADQKAIVDVIDTFRVSGLNPHISFGNKTQRKAAAELVAAHGTEKVVAFVWFAKQVAGRQYAPLVTTPTQLRDKLGALAAFAERLKEAKPKVSIID